MVSSLLIKLSKSRRLATMAVTRRVAARFVAGDRREDALAVARALAGQGQAVSLDLVGEHVTNLTEARRAADGYERTIRAMVAQHVRSGISIKPSQLGASLDPGWARRRLGELAEHARQGGLHVTLDMEDATTTETTLDLVEGLFADGHTNVGCAIQAYLHRSPEDLARLNALGASVRLCKGAYAEAPQIALQCRTDVAFAYRRCAEILVAGGTYPRFATHDHRLIAHVRRLAADHDRASDSYEFQMLYGVRPDLQRRLREVDERVCVYVPFGDAWFPYFTRRLAERPANLAFFLRALGP